MTLNVLDNSRQRSRSRRVRARSAVVRTMESHFNKGGLGHVRAISGATCKGLGNLVRVAKSSLPIVVSVCRKSCATKCHEMQEQRPVSARIPVHTAHDSLPSAPTTSHRLELHIRPIKSLVDDASTFLQLISARRLRYVYQNGRVALPLQ